MFVSMMAMDWISLITKKNILASFLLLASCSHTEQEASSKNELKKNAANSDSKKSIAVIKKPKRIIVEKKIPIDCSPSNINSSNSFVDVTDIYGLKSASSYRSYAVDFNGDGHTDLVFLPDAYSRPQFYAYNKNLKKFIQLKTSPFEKVPFASFLQFADFNHDGVYDILVGTLNKNSSLTPRPLMIYQGSISNESKVSYKEISSAFKEIKPAPTTGLSVFDYDLDGHLDIYEAKGINGGVLTPDTLWKGKGLKFQNASYLLKNEYEYDKNLKTFRHSTPTNSVSICDVNLDGFPDILTASGNQFSNKLWVNSINSKGEHEFIDIGAKSHYAQDDRGHLSTRNGGSTLTSRCKDYNNDGIMDIFMGELSHSYDSDLKDRSSVLTGSSRSEISFLRTEYIDEDLESWSHIDNSALWLDYNNDGLSDLLVENSGLPPKTRLIFFEQDSSHAMDSVAAPLGIDLINPSGVITMDLNRDGKMDIFSGLSNTRDSRIIKKVFLFKNKVKTTYRSIRFYLRGDKSNFFGIGSGLKLSTSKNKQISYAYYATSRAPGNIEEGVHFGIGDAQLKNISVRWPIKVKGKVLQKVYNLSKLKFKNFLEVTLCESGKYLIGKKECR